MRNMSNSYSYETQWKTRLQGKARRTQFASHTPKHANKSCDIDICFQHRSIQTVAWADQIECEESGQPLEFIGVGERSIHQAPPAFEVACGTVLLVVPKGKRGYSQGIRVSAASEKNRVSHRCCSLATWRGPRFVWPLARETLTIPCCVFDSELAVSCTWTASRAVSRNPLRKEARVLRGLLTSVPSVRESCKGICGSGIKGLEHGCSVLVSIRAGGGVEAVVVTSGGWRVPSIDGVATVEVTVGDNLVPLGNRLADDLATVGVNCNPDPPRQTGRSSRTCLVHTCPAFLK